MQRYKAVICVTMWSWHCTSILPVEVTLQQALTFGKPGLKKLASVPCSNQTKTKIIRGCGGSEGRTSWTGMPERGDYEAVVDYLLEQNPRVSHLFLGVRYT